MTTEDGDRHERLLVRLMREWLDDEVDETQPFEDYEGMTPEIMARIRSTSGALRRLQREHGGLTEQLDRATRTRRSVALRFSSASRAELKAYIQRRAPNGRVAMYRGLEGSNDDLSMEELRALAADLYYTAELQLEGENEDE